jgi:hypothetical protein
MKKKNGHLSGHIVTRQNGRVLIRPVYSGSRWAEGKRVIRGLLRTLGKGSKGILRSGKTMVTLRVTQTREVIL